MKVAILGGGVSGLSLAYFLQREGVACEVLEAARVPGGLCRSDVVNGYVMDRAGGHILYSKSEAVRALWADLFQDEPLVPNERQTRILVQNRFVAYPFENGLGDLPPEINFECTNGYIEAVFARRQGAPCPDNFRDWILYRMGEGIARHFMFPYNEKIWKVDLRELGVGWVEGRVPDAPLEDVLRSALSLRTVGYAHQAHFHYPRSGGFQALTDRLAARVQPLLRLETPVEDVQKTRQGVRVNGTPYDLVVSTIPLNELARIVHDLDSGTRQACTGMRFRGLASVLLGIPAEYVLPYSWIYLPFAHQGPANRVTCLSNYSPGNAPPGRGSLLAEVTYEGDLDVTTPFLDDLEKSLVSCGLFPAGCVDLRHFAKNTYAYLVFDRRFEERRQRAIEGIEAYGILPLGRFGRYDYNNSDHCILDAKSLSERIVALKNTGA
ncbi:MAG: FAD-dependent oxidoreductase [Planctomycetota bacterium]